MSGSGFPAASDADAADRPVVVAVDERSDPSVTVDLQRWATLARDALTAEGVPAGAEMNLLFVDEAAIATLNEEHMSERGPTDVLSFPLDFPLDPSAGDLGGEPLLVGDVVVCLEVAARNAPEHAGTTDDELALLVVHGVLHLLGHDHAEADERSRMQERERALLAALHGPLAGDPWSDR